MPRRELLTPAQRQHVLALEGFDDDPKASNEPKLEAIQMAWYEEYKTG